MNLGIYGSVRYFQTPAGIVLPSDSRKALKQLKQDGIMIPGSFRAGSNTIGSDLKKYLAYKLAADVTDQAMDNLFASGGLVASVGAANDGKDGIAWGQDNVAGLFVTTLNDGGDNSDTFAEFYGYVDGAVTLSTELTLGFSYTNGTTSWSKTYATYSINESVAASRRFHFYWKITIG